jgi:hypothetical protein
MIPVARTSDPRVFSVVRGVPAGRNAFGVPAGRNAFSVPAGRNAFSPAFQGWEKTNADGKSRRDD